MGVVDSCSGQGGGIPVAHAGQVENVVDCREQKATAALFVML